MSKALLALCLLKVAGATIIPLATFDSAKTTTLPWKTVNDPVMGGKSDSTFQVDADRKLGIWDGEVAIVPFLKAPGFCNLQAPGLGQTTAFPDVSATEGIVVTAREENCTGLTHFNVQIMTKGAHHESKQGKYSADFSFEGKGEYFIAFDKFQCTWRGEKVSWCPDLKTQLNQFTNIGLGTAFPGTAGKFHLEITSIAASTMFETQETSEAADTIDMAVFDDKKSKTDHTWKTESDPVMGGKSESTWTVSKDGYGEYSGTCRIVPALKAPGFTIALTEMPLFGSFPDVSKADGIILGVKNLDANITDFKFAFCDSRINPYRCQFESFKADFKVPVSNSFSEVFLPWSKFSDKWSAATGAHTAEEPPKASSTSSITQIQIWVEGVAGTFKLQLKYVRAGKAPTLATFLAPIMV